MLSLEEMNWDSTHLRLSNFGLLSQQLIVLVGLKIFFYERFNNLITQKLSQILNVNKEKKIVKAALDNVLILAKEFEQELLNDQI